ncbi:putative quinol monooxygenase [Peristeroidobacter soli]|uniref:putative quinol monooxygenase n=1 Tax=Peristeroidobacter soli TaxID=2497877 RepID=UPI00101B91FE|nr:putative quinol monooxygenase [Peristeroidobacter soli]
MRTALEPLILSIAACLASASAIAAEVGPGKGYEHARPGVFSVVAEVRAKPGKEDELRAVTLPLIELVRGDPKNLLYFLQEDRTSRGHFVFYEVFANEADFEAHNNMSYVKAWLAKLPELADGGVKVVRMEIL